MNARNIASKVILIIAILTTYVANGQRIVFMPQWTAQAQFAGYYVAQEKGFYKDEGIDVEIRHLSQHTTTNAIEMLMNKEIDITCEHLMTALKYINEGAKLVNILQTSQNSALMCVSHMPLKDLTSLNGKDIAIWGSECGGIETIVERKKKLRINWVHAFKTTNLYIYNAVDATLCYSYNEYLLLMLSMSNIPNENILYFSDYGYNYPEDGVYVTEEYYNKHKKEIAKFVAASKKGWDYAREHPQEALEIVMNTTKANNITTNQIHQKYMLEEILRLQINKKTNTADYAPVSEQTYNMITDDMVKTQLITTVQPYSSIFRGNN